MKTNSLILLLILCLSFIGCEGGGGSDGGSATGGGVCGTVGGASCPVPGGGGNGGGSGGGGGSQSDPLAVVSFNPSGGAVGITADSNLSVSFNNQLDPDSVISNSGLSSLDTVELQKNSSGDSISINVSVSGSTINIDPLFSLDPNSTYTIIVKSSIGDIYNQELGSDQSSSFTTSDQGGSNPGNVVSFSFQDRNNVGVVDYFEIHWGETSRGSSSTQSEFQYPQIRQINLNDSNLSERSSEARYTFDFQQYQDQLTSGRTYYFSLTACSNTTGCSVYNEGGDVSRIID